MGTEVTEINWLAVAASSAVIAALISTTFNVAFSAWAKSSDRRREDEKAAKKVGHVYLDVALTLEVFAKRCSDYIYEIESAIDNARSFNDRDALTGLKSVELTFDPEPDWNELPIPFVAQVKGLVTQYAERNIWIAQQFQAWADLDDAYSFESERAAFYGLKASDLAVKIRADINAGSSNYAYEAHLTGLIDQRRKRFMEHRKMSLIPELKQFFDAEAPEPDRL